MGSPDSTKGVHRKLSLVDQVTQGISAKIASGEYALSKMLPSVQTLSNDWQVSRTVLREALARLSANGLITSRQGLGIFVAEKIPARRLELPAAAEGDDLMRIIELRMAVEVEATALAAVRRTADDLAILRDAFKRMAPGKSIKDITGSIDADMIFHRTIYVATRNEHFQTLFASLSGVVLKNISMSRRNSAAHPGRGREAQVEHKAILEAIIAKDRDRARIAARRHIENTAHRLGMLLD